MRESHKLSSNSPNKILNNLIPNKSATSKPIISSNVKYLSYSSKYKQKSSSDNRFNNISCANNYLNKQQVNLIGKSLLTVKRSSDSNSLIFNKDSAIKTPLSEKNNTHHRNLLMNSLYIKPKSDSKNDQLKKSNRMQTPPPNFKSCYVLDSSFNIKDKINKICKSNKVAIKEVIVKISI